MGFNKKYISDETVVKWLENNQSLEKLFKSDALILDGNISSKVYDLFKNGLTNEEILKKAEELKQ